MHSQAYRDGFGDGWSDVRDGRERGRWVPGYPATRCPYHATCEHTTDWYAREYRAGYADGARAYATRLEGRFGAYTEGVQTNG